MAGGGGEREEKEKEEKLHTGRQTERPRQRRREWERVRRERRERKEERRQGSQTGVRPVPPGRHKSPFLRMDGSVIRSADHEGRDEWTRAAADRRQ